MINIIAPPQSKSLKNCKNTCSKKGLSQNSFRFVILRNKVTKDLSFEDLLELSKKDSSLRSE